MKLWRIGIKGFQPNEENLIKALIRLMSADNDFPWVYSPEMPADAYIVSLAEEHQKSNLETESIEIVVASHPEVNAQFRRPIDGPRLHACLNHLSAKIKSLGFSSVDKSYSVTAELRSAALQDIPQSTSNTGEADQEKYKLHRWPPQLTIRENKERIRLSNLLGRKAMSVHDLSVTSGVSLEECKSFIAVLRSLQLVSVTEPTAQKQTVAPRTVSEKNHPAPVVSRGLVSSIRRKLGLYVSPIP